jgi:hypothetical protein
MIDKCPVCQAELILFDQLRGGKLACSAKPPLIKNTINYENHFIWFFRDDSDQFYFNPIGRKYSYFASMGSGHVIISNDIVNNFICENCSSIEDLLATVELLKLSKIFL